MSRKGENIHKRKDGRWEGRYLIYDSDKSKKIYKSLYAHSYKEIKEKLILMKAKETYCQNNNSSYYFDFIMREWLSKYASRKKPSTLCKYTNICNNHISKIANGYYIREINAAILENYFVEHNIHSDSLQKSIISIINQIITYYNNMYNDSIKNIEIAKKRNKKYKAIETINKADLSKLFTWLYHNLSLDSFGIILCLSTGLRLGEVCALKWEDFDFDNKCLYINRTVQRISNLNNAHPKTILIVVEPKSTCSKRIIPLSDEICMLAYSFYKEEGYVITNNKPTDPRTYQYRFHRMLEKAQINTCNFHILRHTFATNCIEIGFDIKSLSEILGHSNVTITLNKYVHPSMETKREQMNNLSNIYGQYHGHSFIETL